MKVVAVDKPNFNFFGVAMFKILEFLRVCYKKPVLFTAKFRKHLNILPQFSKTVKMKIFKQYLEFWNCYAEISDFFGFSAKTAAI